MKIKNIKFKIERLFTRTHFLSIMSSRHATKKNRPNKPVVNFVMFQNGCWE